MAYFWAVGVREAPAYIVPSIFSTAGASSFPCPQIYSPLKQSVDSLRILRLLPGSGELTCRIETTTFRERPRYRALSYEWGTNSRTLPIVINNMQTRIGRNLWQALYYLRHPQDEQLLWVDAICINQHDLAEKARLVPQMSLNFRRAAEVIVWLGLHQPPAAVDLTWMARWTSVFPTIDETYHENWWHVAVPWLFDLMHAGYWKRTWIVQEIGEAVRLSVHFGKQSLPWEAFTSAVAAYRRCFPSAFWTDKISALESLRNSKREGEIYALMDLISIFRDTFCKVPHDKIYAFLGMAADDSSSFIPAAYNKSLAEVHLDVMQFLSGSTFDSSVKKVELVHMSALVRRLLTRKTGTALETHDKPKRILREAEPDTYYENSEPDKDDERERIKKVLHRKAWHDWEHCGHQQKITYWHPTGRETLDLWTRLNPTNSQRNMLKAKGLVVGSIKSFGPTIEKILTSNDVCRNWKTRAMLSFAGSPTQKKMTALYERLLDVIGQEGTARSISSISAFRSNSNPATAEDTDSARLFIGAGGFLGVASPGTRIGDHVVQFWKSSTSAVVRLISDPRDPDDDFTVVGRCSIVKDGYSHDWDISEDKTTFLSEHESSVNLRMSINTLTALTLNSLDLENETPGMTPRPPVHNLWDLSDIWRFLFCRNLDPTNCL